MVTKRPVRVHNASGYAAGCRCELCKAGHSERQRNRRTMGTGSTSAVARLTRPRPMGMTEQAVLDEVAGMDRAPSEVDVLAARNLAAILDNPALISQHPRTTQEFVRQLYVMHPKPQKRKTRRLASVQRLSRGTIT